MASQVFQICALIVLTLLPTVIFVTKQDEIFKGMEVIKVWIAGLGSKAEAFGAQFEAPEAEDVEVADGLAGTMDSILQIQCREAWFLVGVSASGLAIIYALLGYIYNRHALIAEKYKAKFVEMKLLNV
ncbi:unnamed protein product [Caenorhabditis brenneri]